MPAQSTPWTPESKVEFLLRLLIYQNPTPSLSGFKFEGRTTSSMRNQLHTLLKAHGIPTSGAAREAEDDGSTAPASKAKAPKTARKAKKPAAGTVKTEVKVGDEDDTENENENQIAKKRKVGEVSDETDV